VDNFSIPEFTETVWGSVKSTDSITWAGTVLAIVYVVLALRLSKWCWIAGTLSSVLFVFIYFKEQLYYEAALNIVYAALGIYGWLNWKNQDVQAGTEIRNTKSGYLIKAVAVSISIGILLGMFTHFFLKAEFAFADAMISSFSVMATVLTARKYIENWIFWIIIDAVSAVLYFIKGPSMYLVAVLFIFYTFMAISVYFSWKKKQNV
jgi:nicotinamide mononucleotide transporter